MNAHETLRYAVGDSTLGTVIAATSDNGVAAILIADDAEHAVRELRSAFPGVTLVEDRTLAGAAVEAATRLVDAPQRGFAKALPVPASAQDVGAACAANRVAVAMPCHRVVKADGGVSGYRRDVARKRRLIDMERAV